MQQNNEKEKQMLYFLKESNIFRSLFTINVCVC